MSSAKIVSSNAALEFVKNEPPGSKSVYINRDALRDLPERYEALFTTVKFDPQNLGKSFDDVGGGKMMPNTALMYQIADAIGASGGDNVISEEVVELVDYNLLLCKPVEEGPNMQKIVVGHKVVKFGEVIKEDGTMRRSSAHPSVYNAFERCCELWTKEEVATEGYTTLKNGEYTYYNKKKFGLYYESENGYAVEPKYNTAVKRRAHFYSELKFAQSKADTKSWMKCVRELAGLLTGYDKEDLSKGVFVFCKIRRSKDSIRLEDAAHLQAIANGRTASPAADLLFGSEPDMKQAEKPEPEATSCDPVEPSEPAEVVMLRKLKEYYGLDMVYPDKKEMTASCIKWLEANLESVDLYDDPTYKRAEELFKSVESDIPPEKRI